MSEFLNTWRSKREVSAEIAELERVNDSLECDEYNTCRDELDYTLTQEEQKAIDFIIAKAQTRSMNERRNSQKAIEAEIAINNSKISYLRAEYNTLTR